MEFQRAKLDIQNEITDIDGQDIEDQMLKERRDWIQEYRALHGGKPPTDIDKFYQRLNVEEPLSPEEEEKKRLEEEEKAKEKEKKKKNKQKGKKKKKKDEGEKGPQVAKFGPTEVI